MERIIVTKNSGTIKRTDLYFVKLITADGETYENLEPRKLFPFTNPTQYISLIDKAGHEVALIPDPSELDESSEAAIFECLSDYYMIPKITKLISVYDRGHLLKWTVETDHGIIEFPIRNRNVDLKLVNDDTGMIIRDSNDNRYIIPMISDLDKNSLKLIYGYI